MPKLLMHRLVHPLRARRALFLLGAGASADLIPTSDRLPATVGRRFIVGGIFPGHIPNHDHRAEAVIEMAINAMPKSDENADLHRALVRRMPSGFVQIALRQIISTHRHGTIAPPSYAVFSLFRASTIWNYNLDNLAERWCVPRHEVISVHGALSPEYGTSIGDALMESAQEFNWDSLPANELLLVPESEQNPPKLPDPTQCDFVALIGYTFGRQSDSLHDAISFERLCAFLIKNPKPVVVIDPYPEFVAEMISDRIRSGRVYQVTAYWNLFAVALINLVAQNGEEFLIDRLYNNAGSRLG